MFPFLPRYVTLNPKPKTLNPCSKPDVIDQSPFNFQIFGGGGGVTVLGWLAEVQSQNAESETGNNSK